MAHNVETMAYAGETPWHGLGFKVTDKLTPEQMLKAAKCDWGVEKQPMFLKGGQQVPDKYALVRDKDSQVLSVVGSSWKPVQNAEAFDFFKKFTSAGHMSMETAGSLWNGRYVWALARIKHDFKLGKDDEVRGYLLLSQPHIHGKAMIIQSTMTRVVCWNTLQMALGSSLKGNGMGFRMPHSQKFDDTTKLAAELALDLAKSQIDEFKEAATLLSKTKATKAMVDEFFGRVLNYDPKAANKKKDGSSKEPRALAMFQTALTHSPGHDMNTAAGTLWGAVNAVTFVVDHEMGRDREAALKTAWFGTKAALKRKAFHVALDLAKKNK